MRPTYVVAACALLCMPAAAHAQQDEHDDHTHTHSHRGPGPHFIDAFFTENAYLERKIRPDILYLSAEGGNVGTAQIEIEWAVASAVSLIVHAPFHHLSPDVGSSETGIGDLSIGPKFAVVNNPESFILAFGADLEIPTGDHDRGLGSGHAGAGPFALVWVPFGPERRFLWQTASHVEIPFESGEEKHAEIATAFSWTSPLGVTPMLEGITEFSLDGGDPSWWIAPGFRWEFAPAWEVGASAKLPVTGPEADEQNVHFAFGLIRHFPMPF